MAKTEDKGKTTTHDMSHLMGQKPYGNIGPGRTAEEAAVVGKLKKKKAGALAAEGSTEESGEKANVGEVCKSIGNFVNR
jgi:hypothetical protein